MTDLRPDQGRRASRLLPLLPTTRHGTRSHQTCLYRCGNACDAPVPNETDNPYIGDVIEAALSRRAVLRGSVASGALVIGLAGSGMAAAPAAARERTAARPSGRPLDGYDGRLTFTPVPPNTLDELTTAPGYDYQVVARWGDPVVPGAPAFDPYAQTAAKQARQFGYNCDYVSVLPLDDGNGPFARALLVVNHEYTDEQLMFPGVTSAAGTTEEQKRIAMAVHGISVVEIRRIGTTGAWRLARPGRFNRRITTMTPMVLTGPAAGSAYLKTSADPTGRRVRGTLNNCAGGTTPWGTTLHGEENFNQYFGASGPVDDSLSRYKRYGINTTGPSERQWETIEPRFDVAKEPNEPHRFGWVVEVDPRLPDMAPRKHTALGRFKHEGATIRLAEDGRVVAYSGDDERFDYIYKYVSKGRYMPGSTDRARRNNMSLLSEGTLYVARFTGDSPDFAPNKRPDELADGEYDGVGEWIPLVSGDTSYVPGFTAEEVLVFTRLAADAVQPTKMDRPEDIETNPVTGKVYAALTNNSNRGQGTNPGADEANPLTKSTTTGAPYGSTGNRNGYILEWEETGDATATTFTWRLMLVCGRPDAPETYFAGYPKEKVSPISCPDNVAFDPAGNLWIATDGNVLGSNDGLFATPVQGPDRGYVRQFLTVPFGAETCGPLVTDDAKSVFVAVQHPGETTGSTFDTPSSTWPDKRATGGYPRPSVASVFRRGDTDQAYIGR